MTYLSLDINKLFGVNIWQDREIITVMRLYFSQNYDEDGYLKRVEDLQQIERELSDNNQYSGKDVGSNTSKKGKNKSKNKSKKPKKKKSKDNLTGAKEKEAEKLYEINDIDLLCSIIQNSNTNKKGKNT